jgi:hypothetical protein
MEDATTTTTTSEGQTDEGIYAYSTLQSAIIPTISNQAYNIPVHTTTQTKHRPREQATVHIVRPDIYANPTPDDEVRGMTDKHVSPPNGVNGGHTNEVNGGMPTGKVNDYYVILPLHSEGDTTPGEGGNECAEYSPIAAIQTMDSPAYNVPIHHLGEDMQSEPVEYWNEPVA